MAAFSDDFNRPDSSDLGAAWVEVSGDWSIISGQLAPDTSGGSTILRAATPMDSSDNYAQFTIAATVAASQGVWCRGNANISSGYLWRNNGDSWDLFSVVSGSFNVIGTYTAAAAPGDVAKVQAVGSTITGWVNGIQRVSVVNADVTTGTNVGLRVMAVTGLRFDDFAAADVTAGVALNTAAVIEAAQPFVGAKATLLSPAAATETAQPVTGTKTTALGVTAQLETAQALTCTKASPLGPAGATETVQALAGSKTLALGTAVESVAAQPLRGAKTATLGPALAVEQARALAGGGSVAPGPDIDIAVGPPRSLWAADVPHGSGWEVGAPW